jgi:hypothetical protein
MADEDDGHDHEDGEGLPRTSGRAKNSIVVTTLPISTTNMTGMCTIVRGSSLTNA